MQSKLPDGLQILAVDHNDNKRGVLIAKLAQRIMDTKGKRTLFIETTPKGHREVGLSITNSPFSSAIDPFSTAITVAERQGWRIVFLDREKIRDAQNMLLKKVGDLKAGEKRIHKLLSYLNRNLREQYWVKKLIREKAAPGDIIIMHLGHVAGFLAESGITEKHVSWISPHQGNEIIRRLTELEIREYKERRSKLRKHRIQRRARAKRK